MALRFGLIDLGDCAKSRRLPEYLSLRCFSAV
jgi:hypothetical protein